MNKYIVLNFAYGTGPYLMAAKLAVAFNGELSRRGRDPALKNYKNVAGEKAGGERMKIIVPWVYGEKQKKVMAEEGLTGEEFVLDEKLGAILNKVFYQNEDFENYLERWTNNFESASKEARDYLLSNKEYKDNIVLELNRSPRLIYDVAPAYSTSFGMLSRVFKEATKTPAIKIKKDLLEKAAAIYKKIESVQKIIAVGYPGLSAEGAVLVPPIGPITEEDFKKHQNDSVPNNMLGIFITRTGIPNEQLQKLYDQAQNRLGFYPHDNRKSSVHLIESSGIFFHFARSGWASVWRSLVAEKPIVVPEYNPSDDPEIYFNNLAVEKFGIGTIYKGGGLNEIIKKDDAIKTVKITQRKIKKEIKKRWGTLDGSQYCAQLFVDHYTKQHKTESENTRK